MSESRSKNVMNNMTTGALVQIINKLMIFIVRTVFIKTLNEEYLGVNGLFTNILTILSFAELGLGTAIIYHMYKPVAEDDVEKIKSLMNFYKKSYNIIGIAIFLIGLLVIPFMDLLVKDVPKIQENIIHIYVLFLANTSVSYFFTYKKSIISAHQKESIINMIDSMIYLVKSIIEIVFLILTKNYIVYLMMEIIFTMIENFVVSNRANHLYPYLNDRDVKPLSNKEKNSIFSDVKALVIYKMGGIMMNGTDNILISALINVTTVGLVSNYTMVINAIRGVLSSILNGITASVGNLNVVEKNEKKEQIFYQLTFMNFWIYGFVSIACMVLLNPFIKIWLGEKYLLEVAVPIALSITFFIEGLRNSSYTFRVTSEVFKKGKITPYLATVINIVLSIYLGKIWGVLGIFIATSIAQLCSYSWIDPYLIHKYEFKTSSSKYFKKYFMYIGIFIVEVVATMYVTSFIEVTGITNFIVKGIIVAIFPNLINLLVFYHTEEFKSLVGKFINKMKGK